MNFIKFDSFRNRLKPYTLVTVASILVSSILGKYMSDKITNEFTFMDEMQESAFENLYTYVQIVQSDYLTCPVYEVFVEKIKQKNLREKLFNNISEMVHKHNLRPWNYGKPIFTFNDFERALCTKAQIVKVFDIKIFIVSLLFLCALPILFIETYFRIRPNIPKYYFSFSKSFLGLLIKRSILGIRSYKIKLHRTIESLQKELDENKTEKPTKK